MKVGAEIASDWCGTLHRDGDRVVKVVSLPNAEQLKKDLEKHAASRPKHASIATVRESGVEGGKLWLAMNVESGMPLSDFVEKRHRLETKRLVHVVVGLAEALALLHEKGAAHGDVTPENVILHGTNKITLLDFGLTTGEKPTPASDQRLLAATVHRLLTGEAPGAKLSKLRPDLPGGVERTVAKGLSREPFEDVRAFARSFSDAFVDETVLPKREPSLESGIWDVPKRERDRTADPLPRPRASPNWGRRASAIAILVGLFAALWLITRGPTRRRRRTSDRRE